MNFGVGANPDLPMANAGRTFSPSQARSAILKWAKDRGGIIDPEKAAQGFLLYDVERPHDENSYVLPFADIVGGQLTAVPDGVREAFKLLIRNMLPGAIPEPVRDQARRILDGYFARMKKPFGDSRGYGEGKLSLRIDRGVRFSLGNDAHDNGTLLAEETSQGFLKIAPSKLARDGVLVYGDGTEEWLEFRPAEELIEAADSFALVPLTHDHPPEMVTSQNVRHWQAGTVGEVRVEVHDGVTYIVAPLLITDPGLIRAAKSGETCELSIGFLARVWDQKGTTPSGDKYKFVQTDLEGNHVAVVEEGRAGPTCALAAVGDAVAWQPTHQPFGDIMKNHRNDLEAAPAAAPAAQTPAAPPAAPEQPAAPAAAPEMVTVNVPGVGPVEMSATLATVVQALMQQIAAMQQQAAPAPAAPPAEPMAEGADGKDEDYDAKSKDEAEDAKGDEEEDKKDKDKDMDKTDSAAEVQRLQGVVDGLQGQLDQMKANEGERIDDRVELVTDARKVLGEGVSLKGLTDTQIKAKVVAAVDGKDTVPEGRGDLYIEGRYDAAMRAFAASSASSEEDDFSTIVTDGAQQTEGEPADLLTVITDSTNAMSNKWRQNKNRAS